MSLYKDIEKLTLRGLSEEEAREQIEQSAETKQEIQNDDQAMAGKLPKSVRFDYLMIHVCACEAAFASLPDQRVIYADTDGMLLRKALSEGYRWVRTDGDFAVWEKEADIWMHIQKTG